MSGTGKVLLTVVVLALLVCGGLVAALVIGIPKLIDWGKEKLEAEMARDRQWQAFAATWRAPPANIDLSQLFPQKVKEFSLEAQDDHADAPLADDGGAEAVHLKIVLAGRHAKYRDNNRTIDVFVWRATNAERETVYRQVIDMLKRSGGLTIHFHINQWLRYSRSTPVDHGYFWGNSQWLFLARSSDVEDDLEAFLRSYLAGIAGPAEQRPATTPTAPRSPVRK
jgi:hypothetical protein